MECRLERGKRDDEVSKPITVGQLPEEENQQVVPAGKTFDILVAFVLLDEPLEVVNWKKVAQLGEYVSTLVHKSLCFQTVSLLQRYSFQK